MILENLKISLVYKFIALFSNTWSQIWPSIMESPPSTNIYIYVLINVYIHEHKYIRTMFDMRS